MTTDEFKMLANDLDIKDEKIGIHISRKNSLSRCQEQLNNASIKVFYHRYENNFGLIEIEADFAH